MSRGSLPRVRRYGLLYLRTVEYNHWSGFKLISSSGKNRFPLMISRFDWIPRLLAEWLLQVHYRGVQTIEFLPASSRRDIWITNIHIRPRLVRNTNIAVKHSAHCEIKFVFIFWQNVRCDCIPIIPCKYQDPTTRNCVLFCFKITQCVNS